MRNLLIALICLLLTPAAQLPTVIEHSPPGFEEYRDRIPTAGAKWIGFTAADHSPTVNARRAFVRLPVGTGGVLCLEINSRDGRYLGQFRFPLPQHRPAAVELKIPTQFQRELAAYSPRNLVANATLARSCPSSEALYLPVSWTGPGAADSVLISMNSPLPVHVVWSSRGVNRRVNCRQLTGERSAAFNHSCILSRADLGDSAHVTVGYGRLGSYNTIRKTVVLP